VRNAVGCVFGVEREMTTAAPLAGATVKVTFPPASFHLRR
jgi:hypothetical protein